MLPFDSGTWILLGLALCVLFIFAWLFAAWRELTGGTEELPLRSFLERQGVRCERIGARSLRLAGMRCAVCDSRRMCAARCAAGFASPVADCPNATLFSPPGA